MTMNWDDLDDFIGEDDEFFESTNRLSVVVPLDMPLPEFDEDDDSHQFNDSRVSFSHNLTSNSIKEPQNAIIHSTGQYDMWMVAPGSITDRRRRLLQGMGLNSNKDFARLTTTKFNTKRMVSIKPSVTPIETTKSDETPNVDLLVKESSPPLQDSKHVEHELHSHVQTNAQTETEDKTEPQLKLERHSQPEPQTKHEPEPEYKLKQQHQQQAQILDHNDAQTKAQVSSELMLLVRCRSDSDIETSSFNTKRRKEDMIGSVSKQHLTRTSSELVKPSIGLSCQYANVLRVHTPNTMLPKKCLTSSTNNKKNEQHSAQLDSFFLIKNLDTGKEFVVKEFNDEGMWNKVSDLQTGKQLTMDEFENTVGHSPVVKELMRRTSRKRNGNINSKLAMTNSYLSKSFRFSKKKGAAFFKNLRGSMSGSKTIEKEKDEGHVTTTTTTTTTTVDTSSQSSSQHKASHVEQLASNDKNLNSQWVKAKAYGKPSKEFSALHLCQKIEAHDGSIWTMKFSFDGQYLASGGEDKVIRVWEVQECDVKSMRSGEDKGSCTPDNRPPLPDNPTIEKKKKSKNNKKKSEVPEYVKVPESMFGLSEKPFCTFSGHQDDVLDLSWSRSQVSFPSKVSS